MWNVVLDKELINEFTALLLRWNAKINLISKKTLYNISKRHIMDSIQLMKFVNQTNVVLTDFGSGAGFPGIILSYCGIKEVHLIEADSRKAAFLHEAARISPNKVYIHNARVESLTPWKSDIITSRAFTGLDNLLPITKEYFTNDSKGLFLYGSKEIEKIPIICKSNGFDYIKHQSITEDKSFIIEVKLHGTKS
jgi:16S rRNA (guanine527-N7)-methyltransferase